MEGKVLWCYRKFATWTDGFLSYVRGGLVSHTQFHGGRTSLHSASQTLILFAYMAVVVNPSDSSGTKGL